MLPEMAVADVQELLKKHKQIFCKIFTCRLKTSEGYGYSIIDMIFGIPPLTRRQFSVFVNILEEVCYYLNTVFAEENNELN